MLWTPQGHAYKQYHDETAGYTLQNQYTAAYQRWLAAEADYEEALGRFKRECQDAQVDWRKFMRKSKQQRQEQLEQTESISQPNNTVAPNLVEALPDDENEDELYDDDELMRFVDVLFTLRENCNFAKDVMARIQNDIKELTKLEDERHKQQEQQKAAAAAAAAALAAAGTSDSSFTKRKDAKQSNKITRRQESGGSNKSNNQKDTIKNSEVAEGDATDEPPLFPPDPFLSTNAVSQEEPESPLLASKHITSSAYFDAKTSFNGDSNPDHGSGNVNFHVR